MLPIPRLFHRLNDPIMEGLHEVQRIAKPLNEHAVFTYSEGRAYFTKQIYQKQIWFLLS